MAILVHELIYKAAERFPDAEALVHRKNRISYSMLSREIDAAENAMLGLGLDRGERVAVYLENVRKQSLPCLVPRPPGVFSCRSIPS